MDWAGREDLEESRDCCRQRRVVRKVSGAVRDLAAAQADSVDPADRQSRCEAAVLADLEAAGSRKAGYLAEAVAVRVDEVVAADALGGRR